MDLFRASREDPYKSVLKSLQDEISESKAKDEKTKQTYFAQFCDTVGCVPDVAQKIDALYEEVHEEATRKLKELDEKFAGIRAKQCEFFDGLLATIDKNTEGVEKLEQYEESLKNDCLPTSIEPMVQVLIHDIRFAIKNMINTTHETVAALRLFADAGIVPSYCKERVMAIFPKDATLDHEEEQRPSDQNEPMPYSTGVMFALVDQNCI